MRKVPDSVQIDGERRRLHPGERLLDPTLGGGVDLADEGEGQVEGVRLQPARVPEPGLEPADGLLQDLGELQRDEEPRHLRSPSPPPACPRSRRPPSTVRLTRRHLSAAQ